MLDVTLAAEYRRIVVTKINLDKVKLSLYRPREAPMFPGD
jgi:hypothetical protein